MLGLGGLVEAQQAVVDEDGVEAVADGAGEQGGGHSAVHAARDGADDVTVLADDGADALDLKVDERVHAPVVAAAADANDKVAEHLRAVGRVRDLGVELEAKDLAVEVADGGVGRRRGVREDDKALGQLAQLVAVAHPHAGGRRDAGKERGGRGGIKRNIGLAKLAVIAGLHLALEVPRDLLEAVADAEDRHAVRPDSGVHVGGALLVHRVGAAREDDALGLELEIGKLDRAGLELAVHAELTHAARDQVRVLGPKVQNEDSVVQRRRLGGHLAKRRG